MQRGSEGVSGCCVSAPSPEAEATGLLTWTSPETGRVARRGARGPGGVGALLRDPIDDVHCHSVASA